MNIAKQFVRRNWRGIFITITLVVDAGAILFGASISATTINVIPFLPPVSKTFFLFFTGYALLILIPTGLTFGLYRSAFHSNKHQENRIAGKTYLYSFLFVLASFTVFKVTDYQRGFILPFFLVLPGIFMIFRSWLRLFSQFMQERQFGVHNALIVGYDNGGVEIFDRFAKFPELGYNVRGFVQKDEEKTRKKSFASVARFPLEDLPEVIKREKIDRIFIPSPKYITNGYSELIDLCKKKRVKLKVLSPESEDLLRFSRVQDIAGIPLYAPPRPKIELVKRMLKRSFDILGSLILLIFLSPLLIAIMVAILLEDGRPIFFSQRRALVRGMNEFKFLKFRSMSKDAEAQQYELYKLNQTSGGLFFLKDDPRITLVGRMLRKFSLDELPQLINVLKGDMSLVGPRPLSIADLERISPENKLGGYYRLRAKAKPGMTGLWQISGRREVSFKEMVLLDLYYIENQSLLFDLEILFATMPVVLFGRGAY